MLLVQNEYFDIAIEGSDVVLRSKKIGYPIKSFDEITRENPRLKINSFSILMKALTNPGSVEVIGDYLQLIELSISQDKMTVEMMINTTEEEFISSKDAILQEAELALDKKGVTFGRKNIHALPFTSGIPIVVAQGVQPKTGANAEITYYELEPRKPIIREDGSANYYEMNFVTAIAEGDWLGEKIPAQDGIQGSDVFGTCFAAKKGEDKKFKYDRKSVIEVEEEGKIVLRAVHAGVLENAHGIIGVGKQLIITGDVGPETGSITFEGAVHIYGTVLAGYSINATGDISIEGNEGVTNPKEIISSEGDVYIKGGIFGGGVSIVQAKNSIFVKHANNCNLISKEIHVGLYLLGSDIKAEHVFVDKNRGKIIGGNTDALYTIETAYAGNQHERATKLSASGIDKERLYQEVQQMAKELKEKQEYLSKIEEHLSKFESLGSDLNGPQLNALEKMQVASTASREAILELDHKIQIILHSIKEAVQPKIEVTREAFPGVIINIENKISTLHSQTKGKFQVIDGVLNV